MLTPTAAIQSVWNASMDAVASEAGIAGAGIDLVDLAAFAVLRSTGGSAFLDMGWTSAEQSDSEGALERLAARWAAKEAVMKALRCGLGDLDPLDVEIVTEAGGAPHVRLHRDALAVASSLDVHRWHISLCHEDGWVAAIAIAERLPSLAYPSQRLEGVQDA